MQAFFLTIHIIVSLLLIIVVLLQSGKGADLAGAFGGAGSQSTFGPRGTASLLSKITTTLAVLFMVTSLVLWILASKKGASASVLDAAKTPAIEQTTAPKGGQTPSDQKPAAAPIQNEQETPLPATKPAEEPIKTEEKKEDKK